MHTPSLVPEYNVSTMSWTSALCLNSTVGYLNGVFTLAPSEWRTRAACPGTKCGSIFTLCSHLVPEQDPRWATQLRSDTRPACKFKIKVGGASIDRWLNTIESPLTGCLLWKGSTVRSYFSLEVTGSQTVKLTLSPSDNYCLGENFTVSQDFPTRSSVHF